MVFAPEAQADLAELWGYIAEHGRAERAFANVERIEVACHLATFPQRGTRRDDIRPRLRVIGFAPQVAIAFHLTADDVTCGATLRERPY